MSIGQEDDPSLQSEDYGMELYLWVLGYMSMLMTEVSNSPLISQDSGYTAETNQLAGLEQRK